MVEQIIEKELINAERIQNLTKFFDRQWLESETVQELFSLNFETCMQLFEYSRVAEWWSIVGETKEERRRQGQKITIYFRLPDVKVQMNVVLENVMAVLAADKHMSAVATLENRYIEGGYDVVELLKEGLRVF